MDKPQEALELMIGRFAACLFFTGLGGWIATIAAFAEFRDPLAAALCLAVATLAFAWGLSLMLRAMR